MSADYTAILATMRACSPRDAQVNETVDGRHIVTGEHEDRELTFAVSGETDWVYFVARSPDFRRAGVARPESLAPLSRWLVGGAWPELGLMIGGAP